MVENELAGSPYKYLLEDKKFKRWYENIRRRSIGSAHESIRRFGRIHKMFDKLPSDFVKMGEDEAGEFLLDMVTKLEEGGKSGSYISNLIKPVKNWLSFNGIEVKRRINISNRNQVTTVNNEVTPTQDQLRQIFLQCDDRARVIASLMAFGGVRPQVMGNIIGKEGLKIKDFGEMTVKDGSIEFAKVPTMLTIRSSLSKTKQEYFTFLPEEGCMFLKVYLESRIKKGESLTADSPIITQAKTTHLNKAVGTHIASANLAEHVKNAIKRAGFEWRPYVLRRFFDTGMMMAEHDQIILRDWRVFWMGHKGDIEHTYTLNKKLPPDIIEKMREAFAKASDKYLVTVPKRDTGLDAVKAQFNRQFLLIAGFSEQDADSLGDLSQLTPEDISRLVQEKQKRALGLNGNNQKVVPMTEVKEYIAAGWEYVRDLQQDAIIRLPAH